MLDIRLLREQPDFVKAKLAARGAATAPVDAVLTADTRLRAALADVEGMRAERKRASDAIGSLMREGKKDDANAAREAARDLGDRIAIADIEVRALEAERDDLLFYLPNLPAGGVPEGGEDANVVVREHGELRSFEFTPRAHWDIATDLGLIDWVRGAKLSGSGFVLWTGLGAQLERALIAFMLDLHTTRHGYVEMSTPFFLGRDSMRASAHLAKFTPEMYHDAESDLFALPTAEPALVNIHRDEILDGRDLPLRFAAYSPCWRREAGAAGKDTRGLLRVHQFDKVEMVKYTLPEASDAELDLLVTEATDVLDALGLPYRVKLLAGGDMSFSASKCFDIETYAPGVGAWLEVSSCSDCTDFQARQGNIRFRREPGAKPEFVHLLNGSGVALPRLVATLLETHQNADGTVSVPEPLRPYLGGRAVLGKETTAPSPTPPPSETGEGQEQSCHSYSPLPFSRGRGRGRGHGILMQFTHEVRTTVPLAPPHAQAHWTEADHLPHCVSHVRAALRDTADDLARIVIMLDGRLIEFAAQRTMCAEHTVCWQSLGPSFLWVLTAQFAPHEMGTELTVTVAYDPPGFLPDVAEAIGTRKVFRRALEADLKRYARACAAPPVEGNGARLAAQS